MDAQRLSQADVVHFLRHQSKAITIEPLFCGLASQRMYLSFFDLQQAPFSITPDPEFVYLSEKHQESLAHLIYGVTRGGGAGFVQLTGEVGTGKTTISRLFLQQLPEDTQAALILNPNINPTELLETLCKEFKIPTRGIKGKLNAMVNKLNDHLLKSWAAGTNTLVIIDEAQNIPRDTLEQLRLLTNLETDQQKLLQIILIGQPELKQLMQRKDLRQLAQRVTSRFHLQPLSAAETSQYINHRIAVSGGQPGLFSRSAIQRVYQQTQGIPRLINVLCDRSLLVAFAAESPSVKLSHVKQAISEVYPDQAGQSKRWWWLLPVPLLVALLWWWFAAQPPIETQQSEPPVTQAAVQPVSNKPWQAPPIAVSWQQYLNLWGESSAIIWSQATCPPISLIGMACLRKQGNLNQLKQQNIPALLQLTDGQLVLLKSMSNEHLTLVTNAGDLNLPYQDLDQRWYGQYFVVWPIDEALIDDTIDSQVSTWALQLAQVIDNNPDLNSEMLPDWIKNFQQNNGLLADGIIGKETQMALSIRAYHGPKLTE